MGSKLKVLDYNIRYADDGEGKMIADRAPRLEALIRKYQPDVIGLQEATRRWINQLEDRLYQDYKMRYLYRAPTSREATPILWKRDKFELCGEGHFWFSDTPEMPSKMEGARHCRICNWVRLRIKETGEQIIFANSHLQGAKYAARSAEMVLERLEAQGAFSDYGAFFTGDFNVPPESDCCRILNESGRLKDINVDLGFDPSITNNGFNERPDDAPICSIKDYIFYTPSKMIPLKYQVLNENYFDGWISDHRGLYAEVELKD